VRKIKTNWYNYIPEEARPPQLNSGETTIEFAILKDGRVAGMEIVQPAGSVAMDRAAWGGLVASNPFDPLPKEFKG
jgi:TonB family protein